MKVCNVSIVFHVLDLRQGYGCEIRKFNLDNMKKRASLYMGFLGTAFHVHTAVALRTRQLMVQANAAEVLKSIHTEVAWEWAKNPGNEGKLDESIKKLNGSQTTWQSRFVAEQPEDFKKLFDVQTIGKECKAFLDKHDTIGKIEQFIINLRAKHAMECKLAKQAIDQQHTPKKTKVSRV